MKKLEPDNKLYIRGCSGLGDAVYMYPVVKEYIERGNEVVISSLYPEIFETLDCEVVPRAGDLKRHDIRGSYVSRKHLETCQYVDVLLMCKCPTLPLEIKYNKRKVSKLIREKAEGDYILTSAPYYRENANYSKPMPSNDFMNNVLKEAGRKVIQVGKNPKSKLNCDVDLIDKTSIVDLLYLVDNAKSVFTQVGYLLPMAEALNKRVVSVLAEENKNIGKLFVRQITPRKVLTPKKDSYCFYDSVDYKELGQML